MKSIDKVKDKIKAIDAFGHPTTLFYNGEEEFKSVFGAALTVLIFAFTLLLSFTVFKDFVLRDDPDFKSDVTYNPEPDTLNLTTKEFHIAVSLEDTNHDFNHAMVGVRVRHAYYYRYPNGTLVKTRPDLPMKKCTKEENFPDYPAEFDAYRLDTALCPEFHDIPLSGVFQTQVFRFFEVLVEECDDSIHYVSGITCAPKAERDLYFSKNRVKAQVFFRNYQANPSNVKQPFTDYITNLYYIINQRTLAKNIDVFVRDTELDSYEDYINSNLNTPSSRYTVDGDVSEQIFTPNGKDLKVHVSIVFRRSTSNLHYTRSLTNLPDLISYFGGLWGILYGICHLAAASHNSLGFRKSLSDSIFRFENPLVRIPKKGKAEK